MPLQDAAAAVPRAANRAARIQVWEAMLGLLPEGDGLPEALDALAQLAALRQALEDEVLRCVATAFDEGHTWEAIGVALRCSAQAAHKRYAAKVAAAVGNAELLVTGDGPRRRSQSSSAGARRSRRPAPPPPATTARKTTPPRSEEAPTADGTSRVASRDSIRRRAQSLLAQGHSVEVVAAATGWSVRAVRQLVDTA